MKSSHTFILVTVFSGLFVKVFSSGLHFKFHETEYLSADCSGETVLDIYISLGKCICPVSTNVVECVEYRSEGDRIFITTYGGIDDCKEGENEISESELVLLEHIRSCDFDFTNNYSVSLGNVPWFSAFTSAVDVGEEDLVKITYDNTFCEYGKGDKVKVEVTKDAGPQAVSDGLLPVCPSEKCHGSASGEPVSVNYFCGIQPWSGIDTTLLGIVLGSVGGAFAILCCICSLFICPPLIFLFIYAGGCINCFGWDVSIKSIIHYAFCGWLLCPSYRGESDNNRYGEKKDWRKKKKRRRRRNRRGGGKKMSFRIQSILGKIKSFKSSSNKIKNYSKKKKKKNYEAGLEGPSIRDLPGRMNRYRTSKTTTNNSEEFDIRGGGIGGSEQRRRKKIMKTKTKEYENVEELEEELEEEEDQKEEKKEEQQQQEEEEDEEDDEKNQEEEEQEEEKEEQEEEEEEEEEEKSREFSDSDSTEEELEDF